MESNALDEYGELEISEDFFARSLSDDEELEEEQPRSPAKPAVEAKPSEKEQSNTPPVVLVNGDVSRSSGELPVVLIEKPVEKTSTPSEFSVKSLLAAPQKNHVLPKKRSLNDVLSVLTGGKSGPQEVKLETGGDVLDLSCAASSAKKQRPCDNGNGLTPSSVVSEPEPELEVEKKEEEGKVVEGGKVKVETVEDKKPPSSSDSGNVIACDTMTTKPEELSSNSNTQDVPDVDDALSEVLDLLMIMVHCLNFGIWINNFFGFFRKNRSSSMRQPLFQ